MAFDPIEGLLKRLDRLPAWRSNQPFLQLCQQWPEIVGAAVAGHARPLSVRQGVLFVAVSNPAWAQTLTFERSRLVAKINRAIEPPFNPPLTDARFSTGRWFDAPDRPTLAPKGSARPDRPPQAGREMPPDRVRPASATEAFEQWAARVKQQAKRYDPCPRCGRGTPPAELDRWGACAPCMSDRWSRLQSSDPNPDANRISPPPSSAAPPVPRWPRKGDR
jgi:predicted nucleic acid-binding Zn ribbon protein